MHRLFVSNINYEATALDLEALFASEGFQPLSVKLCTNKETGAPRGFAFVEFRSEDEVGRAIAALDGWPLLGRRLNVQRARDEEMDGRSRDRQPGDRQREGRRR